MPDLITNDSNNLAPIVLFVYNRPSHTRKTVEALQLNNLAKDSELFIFSDAPKDEKIILAVNEVRDYIKSITGFKTITVYEAEHNKGLASSIIDGVTSILDNYGKIIVLEDDLVTSTNFLNYMNQALDFYANKKKVFSISGFSIPIKGCDFGSDVYFTLRASCWGWATWKNRWATIDWNVEDYHSFKIDSNKRRAFNQMGSDMSNMLDRQMRGVINSWAIRWCYHQFKSNLYSVHPFMSKIQNVGFNSSEASNTKEKYNRYKTVLDNSEKKEFTFSNEIKVQSEIIAQFIKPFSLSTRLIYKIKNIFF